MNMGIKPTFLLIILVVMIAGCIDASNTKPNWAHGVNWLGGKPDSIVEKELWTQIYPYNVEYDLVNISAKSERDGLHLRVVGISNAAKNPDVYDFTYSDGTLTRTSYLLEALKPHDRDAAIVAAMRKKDVMEKGAHDVPTVRRILPDTSKKYYTAKTLLSVTWTGISVLVDPDEWKVVKVWNENAGIEDIIIDHLNACVHWKSQTDCDKAKDMIRDYRLDFRYLEEKAKNEGILKELILLI